MKSTRVTIELDEELLAEVERLRINLEMQSKSAVIEQILRELLVKRSRKIAANAPKDLKDVIDGIMKRVTAMTRKWKYNIWEQ